ncbi:MAG: flagellin [Candidatus Eremiobacteraeota bacterium]|nr:flagellin [Candidatus Eremiobacteraeota bacterium]
MAQGLSIANNLLANSVQFNLNNNQSALKNIVTQLSSGLRINSAADDPSGLAIATNLQTQVDGFNTAVQNVQSANNAAQVALGALSTTTDILQRIRSLAVEASSSLNSNQDRLNLQAEVSQLLLEVNSISQSVNFNGQPLLDGSHAGFQPQQDAYLTVTSNSALATNGGLASANGVNTGFLVATVVAANANFFTTPGTSFSTVSGFGAAPVVQNGSFTAQAVAPNTVDPINTPVPTGWTPTGSGVNLFNGSGAAPPLPAGQQGVVLQIGGGGIQQTLTGLTTGATYQVSFEAGSYPGGSTLQVQANGTPILNVAPSSAGYTGYSTATFVATGSTATISFTNTGPNDLSMTNVTASQVGGTVDGTIEVQVVNTGVSIAAQETFVQSATGQVCVSSTLYSADSTSSAFDNVAVTFGNFTTADVGTTSYIKVSQNVAALTNPNNPAFNFQSGANEGDVIQIGIQATNTQTLRISNINLALSAANNPSIGSEDAIGQIDIALATLLNQQAQLGAVVVRLNEDANNDNIAAVNLQASESSIRDLNVGQATTEFTKLQVLVQVGTSVLSQSNSNAQSVLGLFR